MAINYLPGFEPDFDVKQELRFIGGMPDLHQFDYVYISCSGGKDSHAMAYVLAELATMQNYDKRKMELIYADTGLEWHDTFEQVKRIGTALGIKAVKVLPKYKLLDNVRRRWAKFNGLPDNWQENCNDGGGDRQTDRQTAPRQKNGDMASPFPNQTQRFCNSDHKRNPIESYVKKFSPFPDVWARWCTSREKTRPIEKNIRNSFSVCGEEMVYFRGQEQHNTRASAEREQNGGRLGAVTILMCSGERREESSKRATYPEWSIHEALTTKKRRTYRWRPMLDYKVADVWSMVRDSGIEAHEAYAAGCDRLGCVCCIFAQECGKTAKDVKINCQNNPEMYEELDKLETDTGYTMSISGVRVRDIVRKA